MSADGSGDHEAFGSRLRASRLAAGLSQEELASRSGVSVRAISDLERGRTRWPHPDSVDRLAEALGLGGAQRAEFVARAARRLAGPGAGAGAAAGVRYSLPPDTAAFTGRQAELDRIIAAVTGTAVTGTAGSGGVVAIHAIGGMPGVGKTALAMHAAHVLKDRFPDRQLFFSLHGHTPGRDPVAPGAALAGLLAATGLDARSLPAGLEGRAALWRDRTAGQRALLVLDNAASSAQVAPLLPGGEGWLVLVTSRRHLGDLPAAVPLLLEVLPPEQAEAMFIRLAPRAADGPAGAVTELVRLAGCLPLAISLLARVYARHPSWTLADLAAETRAGMLTLAAEHDSVGAAFGVSYRHLDPVRQEFFRRLGLHPGTTIDGYAAAALADSSLEEAERELDALHGEGLLAEAGYRRYGMHDLIRRYARDHAAAIPAADSGRALDRLLDYYQHAGAIAEAHLSRQTRPAPAPAGLRPPPGPAPDLGDAAAALAWARAERDNLLACLDHATGAGRHARVIALTAAIAVLLRRDGPWADAIARHAAAAQAARHLGDRLGEASALTELGVLRRMTGQYPAAAQALDEALGMYRGVGSRLGEANALSELAVVRRATAAYPEAARALDEALGIYRSIGDRLGQATALSELAVVRRATAAYPEAARALEEALGLYRGIGNRIGQASVLNVLGIVRRMTGDHPAAARALQESLDIYRGVGSPLGQANVLSDLGVVYRITGDHPAAARALQEALDIYRSIRDRVGEANALSNLAAVRRIAGDHPAAARALDEALGIYRSTGDRGGEAEALNEAGTLHRARGDLGGAAAYHRQALDLAREIDSAWDEAHALAGLGRCALAAGRPADAQHGLRQALEIFQRIGAAEAADVAVELGNVTATGPATGP